MKLRYLLSVLMIPMLLSCQPVNSDDNKEDQDTEVTDTTQTPTPAPTPDQEEELAPEIKSGDRVLAPDPNVEKFVTEVTYPDHDYSYSLILDYYGGYNGKLAEGESVKSDKPSAYTIRWTADEAAGDLLFELCEPDWKYEQKVSSGMAYVDVTNLTPDVHYTYKVTSTVTGAVMTEGEFDTYGSIRQVFFKTRVRNGRDLGGWRTYDGKMVRYHKIFRTGRWQSGTMSNSGKKAMIAEGIKAQLDLRGTSDVLDAPAIDGMDFCAPIIETGGDSMLKAEGGDKTRQCMQFVIDCIKADKPVVFHCSLGRDRTGTLALVILGLLDVIEGDISKEYEVSYFSPRGWSIAESETYKIFQNTRTKWAYKPAAEYLWTYVKEGERFSDGVERYLLEIGISQDDIDEFRELMLVEAPVEE